MIQSFGVLVSEHDAILDSAAALRRLLDNDAADVQLGHCLVELGRLVSQHVTTERSVFEQVPEARLSPIWQKIWGEGLKELRQLETDLSLLLSWDEESIATDRRAFADCVAWVLPRLSERLRSESDALYATALQSSALSLI